MPAITATDHGGPRVRARPSRRASRRRRRVLQLTAIITLLAALGSLSAGPAATAVAGPTPTAATAGGLTWAWGRDDQGELGMPPTAQCPERGPCIPTPVQVSGLTGIVGIAGGFDHTLWLKSDGTVWSAGFNLHGQLGNGTLTNSTRLVAVKKLTGVVALAAGDQFSLALKSDGTVWGWGSNFDGELGITSAMTDSNGLDGDSIVPARVNGLSSVVAIAAGSAHALALRSDGTVWSWDSNGDGQLGRQAAEMCGPATCSETPALVSGLSNITALAAGAYHSLAVTADGSVWAWGQNFADQLGYPTSTTCSAYPYYPCSVTPLPVPGIASVAAVAAGDADSVALKIDGTVWSWGSNVYGELGDGTLDDSISPVQAVGMTGVRAIAVAPAYGATTLALKSDGSVWSWGDGYFGQFGNGSLSESAYPSQAGGLSQVTAIGAGDEDGFAITVPSTGTVSLNPASGSYRATITATGAAFAPGETVHLYWDTASTLPLSTTVAAADGSFVSRFSVPQAIAGTHSLIAVGASSGISATASFTVKPQVRLLHFLGPQGSVDVLTGTGFAPNETVETGWARATPPTTPGLPLGSTATNALGTFASNNAITFTVPLSGTGAYLVAGIGQSSHDVAVTPFFLRPTLTVTPPSGAAGTTVTIAGTGYWPGETVTLKWNYSSTATLGTPVADVNGDFGPISVQIPATAFPGTYPITAVGASSGAFVNTFFTVTP